MLKVCTKTRRENVWLKSGKNNDGCLKRTPSGFYNLAPSLVIITKVLSVAQ